MKKFDKWNPESICPICGTKDDKECVLIPIDGTGDGKICEGLPVHSDCINLRVLKMDEKHFIVYMKVGEALT